MRWTDLLGSPRLATELSAYNGTTLDDLVLDLHDVPGWEARLDGMSPEERGYAALRYFGDEGNPQPVDRREWPFGIDGDSAGGLLAYRTPDRGRLRSLESNAAAGRPRRRPGPDPKPFDEDDFWGVHKMLGPNQNKSAIARKFGLSTQAVDRIEKFWLANGRGYVLERGQKPGTLILRPK